MKKERKGPLFEPSWVGCVSWDGEARGCARRMLAQRPFKSKTWSTSSARLPRVYIQHESLSDTPKVLSRAALGPSSCLHRGPRAIQGAAGPLRCLRSIPSDRNGAHRFSKTATQRHKSTHNWLHEAHPPPLIKLKVTISLCYQTHAQTAKADKKTRP